MDSVVDAGTDEDVSAVQPVAPMPPVDTSSLFRKMPLRALVRIFVSRLPKDWKTPWRVPSQKRCTGTGFIIDGRLIVTNAHVVRNHTNVRVRQHGETKKCPAVVKMAGDDCDLAILTVDDEKFWEKVGSTKCELREDIPALGEEGEFLVTPKMYELEF